MKAVLAAEVVDWRKLKSSLRIQVGAHSQMMIGSDHKIYMSDAQKSFDYQIMNCDRTSSCKTTAKLRKYLLPT